MNNLEIRRYQMLSRVRDFGSTHLDAFPSSSYGADLFAIVNGAVAELADHGTEQTLGSAKQSTTTKAVLRADLHDDMISISRTAKAIAVFITGLDEKFQMPEHGNDQRLLNSAHAFAKNAVSFISEFKKRELPTEFFDEFNNKIKLFENVVSDQNVGNESRLTSTAAIDQAIDKGLGAVRQLDSVVRNRFRHDSVTLTAWLSASHTEKSPRSTVKQPDTQTQPSTN